ncbi:MAG: hypothetical protein IPJ30_08340 [Acidobacteria bacterium]|nr:hypothetical protein [Acidobacteriota bacterium]MBK8149379.1 hypothetical protein [Acidobacteriota bacterium]
MKKLTMMMMMLVCIGGQFAAAQDKTDAKGERESILRELTDVKKEQNNPINSLLSVADVGDPDSFGRNVKFLGTAATGVVYVYRSCDPAILLAEVDVTLGADDRCLAHTVGGPTSAGTFNDIGRITIPGRSVDNVIFFVLNNTISNDFNNDFANGLPAFFRFTPRLTIESTALNDPLALDPTTGLPLNGSLTISAFGTKVFNRTIPANDFEFDYNQSSSASTRGFARSYFADLGLPQTVINKLYNRPMTIRLGISVSARGVSFGQYLYAARFMGN